jgi:hypothetical protein
MSALSMLFRFVRLISAARIPFLFGAIIEFTFVNAQNFNGLVISARTGAFTRLGFQFSRGIFNPKLDSDS